MCKDVSIWTKYTEDFGEETGIQCTHAGFFMLVVKPPIRFRMYIQQMMKISSLTTKQKVLLEL